MNAIAIRRYAADGAAEWNAFVRGSRNGTFLFDRGFMDYHADRFDDHSLIFEDRGRMIAVLPAHVRDAELVSHAGLTYGGLVLDPRATLATVHQCFDALLAYIREKALRRLVYKTIPSIYHRQPSDDDRHALFVRGAALHRRDVLLTIDQAERGVVQERRTRARKLASRSGLMVRDSDDYAAYWQVLSENLRAKYDTTPVHTLDEIRLLAAHFPENIRLTVCTSDDQILAGVVVFVTDRVAHLQYIGSSAEGRERGALDAVFAHLLDVWRDKRYVDFGMASEDNGRMLNEGLVAFKEGFGARTIVHDHYTLDIAEERT
ncbi:MAG: GNAT family N-acetyltransferase [Acidobacteriota bacterium]|nr:GNAT family N-acetyltransferase [Acidobacteriota bacterium]